MFQKQNSRELGFKNGRVINVIANDLNGDKTMDLVVELNYTKFNSNNKIEYYKAIEIYLNDAVTGDYKLAYTLPIGHGGILVADFNGDRLYFFLFKKFRFDVLFFDSITNNRKVLYFDGYNPIV